MARKKPPKETIWLVIYVFPHKQDVAVYPAKTKEAVPDVVGKVLLEIADDVKDTKASIYIVEREVHVGRENGKAQEAPKGSPVQEDEGGGPGEEGAVQ
jgi:hypothetical protein